MDRIAIAAARSILLICDHSKLAELGGPIQKLGTFTEVDEVHTGEKQQLLRTWLYRKVTCVKKG